jgi:hypothetical protein
MPKILALLENMVTEIFGIDKTSLINLFNIPSRACYDVFEKSVAKKTCALAFSLFSRLVHS